MPDRLDKRAFGGAITIIYLCIASGLPLLDYRGRAFFYSLGIFGLSPFLLVLLVLCTATVYSAILTAMSVVAQKPGSLRASIAFVVFGSITWAVVATIILPAFGTSPPRWLGSTDMYTTIALVVAVALGLVVLLLNRCVEAMLPRQLPNRLRMMELACSPSSPWSTMS